MQESIRVLVNGAQGKMGQLAVRAIENAPDLNLVGQTGRKDNLIESIAQTQAHVVLDLTNANVVKTNAEKIIQAGAYPVIGTSGLLAADIRELQQLARQQKIGGIIVPNFSIGAVLMMKFAAMAGQYLSEVEIIEAHHRAKIDAPSGTALRTAELISSARSKDLSVPVREESGLPGARGAEYAGIPIHSLRLSGICAEQEVIFSASDETLRISHTALNRQCFMPGVVLACKEVRSLKELVVGLENLLAL